MSRRKRYKKKKSVAPIYALAILWLIWATKFDLYTPVHFVTCGLVSLVVYLIAKAIWPTRKVEIKDEKVNEQKTTQTVNTTVTPKPEPAKFTTGDEELDRMISDKDKAIAEMHRLNDAIADEKVSSQIEHLEIVTTKIVKYVVEHPEKKKQVRRFFNYYLPTTLKLLNAYDRMDDAGVSGMNIDGTMGKVENMMDTAIEAYDRQLDALFADEALDISTDISVMENLLKSEGLVNSSPIEEFNEAIDSFPSGITIDDVLSTGSEEKAEQLTL
ncbi:MAG: 5-bromo-4-chloroindolyl phosphate hydrolysis family protein [Lachnospiraceae bacterium]|nr:5-bromo-4-chloroindolyl phosphate hydrolysis family protein [Lachnospiraceae bacterium]